MFRMGASASMNPDTFAVVKAEYEARKGEITDDAEMFNHLRTVIEGGPVVAAVEEHHAEEVAAADPPSQEHHEEAAPPAEEHVEVHAEETPAEAAPAEEAQ